MLHRLFAVIVAFSFLLNGLCGSDIFAETILTQPHHQAMKTVESELKPGSLIFHRGKCLSVKLYTRSPFTHVAIVVPERKGPGWIVYDSARKHGVRKSRLSDYLEESSPDAISFLHPCNDLNPNQSEQLRNSLDEQLGRHYSVKQHLTGNRAKGIHCSEYVTDALIAIDLLRANKPPRVSPASLLEGILQANIYHPGTILKVALPIAPVPQKTESWCSRVWNDTKTCTSNCYSKMRQLIPCRDEQ